MTLKVVTVLGTRPEIIRLSRVIAALEASVDHRLVHTGQNHDPLLSDVFFSELDLRSPDHYLGIDTSSIGATLGSVLLRVEPVLEMERPDALLVLGDTNSSIAAVLAKRMKIAVYHMEAGNRCFDENVPEELNRRVVDHVADFNLVYTEHARRNLLAEGLHPRRIYLTGSPLCEVLDHFRQKIEASDALARLGLKEREFLLASLHRAENVDNPTNLALLLEALHSLHHEFGVPVVVSTHPRTRQRLDALGYADSIDEESAVRFLHPFGYFDYNKLQTSALCVLSDSGSISEEAAILGFPAVTLRNAMERPEAMDTGSIVITGLDVETILAAVRTVTGQRAQGTRPDVPIEYMIRNCSQRVLNLIVGTARLNFTWSNLAITHDTSSAIRESLPS